MEPRGGAPGQAAQAASGSPLRATVSTEYCRRFASFEKVHLPSGQSSNKQLNNWTPLLGFLAA